MAVKFSNNAVTTLTDSPSAGATSFNVASASAFPTLASGDWTYVSLTSEVVKVTAISGTTFTCDATSNAHASGESVELRMTAELLNDFAEDTESLPIGGGTMTGDVSLGTNVKAKFGADNDLQIYSDGMSSHIVESGTGNLNIKGDDLAFTNSAANKTYLNVDAASGSVYIRHGGSTKLVTTATGVDVTGSVTCDGFTSTGIDDNATSTAITIDASENIALSGTLEVNGNMSLTTNDGFAYLSNVGTGNSGIYVRGIGVESTLRSHSTGHHTWETLGSERMRITSAGRVGIGTSSPERGLHVTGGFVIGGGYQYVGAHTSDGLWGATATPNRASPTGNGDLLLGYQDNSSGLYSAAYGFEVKSTDGAANTDRVVHAIRMKDTSKGTYPFHVKNNGAGYFQTSVGIGTDAPAAKLDVNGTGRFSGSVTLGSNPSNPGSLVLNDNSTTAYTMAIQGSSTRTYEMRGSNSGSSYSLNLLNDNTASGFHLNVYGGAVFNQNGDNFDFRVESNGNANMLFVDGGSDGVGIGTNVAGNSTLEVRSTGVDGTYANAIGFQYSGNSNEANTISTSVSSNANSSGFKFNCSDGGGSSGKTSVLKITRADMVVNDDSYDYDFRVESDNMTHALFVQGNDGKVGVFNTAPRSTLEVGATNARHGIQLNGGPNGTATQIHMIDGKAGSYSTLTIEVQLGGAGGYFYQVQVAGTSGCKMQAGGGYTNGTNNFSHSTGSGSGFSVTSPSNNLIRLVSQGGVGTHPGCEIRMTQALSANHDQDNVTITWS